MKTRSRSSILVTTLLVLAVPLSDAKASAAATTQHHNYKLIVIGTLGGPQSFGDGGHNAANINAQGVAAGVADTAIRDPLYPLYNPGFASLIGLDPYVYHGFITKDGTPIDLGGLPGGTDSTVSYLTANGLVSGQALDGSIDPIFGWQASKAVAWIGLKIIDLGTLGGYESAAGQMNSHGQVTGYATNAISDPVSILYYALGGGLTNGTETRGLLWDPKNGMQDIGTLGGPDTFAFLINEKGQISGFSYKNSTVNATTGFPTTDPFVWENGQMIDLGTLGGTNGLPGDLNNHGQVVGTSNLAGDTIVRGFLWTPPGPMRDLGTLGGPTAMPQAINESGEVIGFADTPSSADAFLWRKGVMTDLGVLPGDCFSGAFGINAKTQVTGQSFPFPCDGSNPHAFLWEDGDMIDLNQFVPPGVGITLTEVEHINDRGEIFGIGTLADGNDRAFFLIPCDEGHPNIEGCDYGPMAVSTVAGSHSAPQRQMTPEDINRIHALLIKQYHGLVPRTLGNRR